ncbi:MAG: DNA repair protein RadC [Parabacteroides sp.]
MKIKEWSPDDRPREKMLAKGLSALSDAELLAILIGSGNAQETAVQLSQRILNSVDYNLYALGKLSIQDLTTQFKGIGTAKAVSIAAALELGRRRNLSEIPERPCIRSSRDAWQLIYPHLADLTHEELWILLLNRAGRVIETRKISQGGTGDTSADLCIILKAAIQVLACGLILCHNHPSGNLHPSRQDDQLTQRLKQAAELIEIKLLDHLIVADNRYYSYSDEGKI